MASVAVSPGQPLYFTPAGALTNVSPAVAPDNTPAPGWQFDSTALAGALGRVIRI